MDTKKLEKRRMSGVIIIEVNESNPNGDPDRESDPRTLPDRRGVISSVSFKRKIRDLVLEKEGPVWEAVANRLDLKPDEFAILEDRNVKRSDVEKLIAGTGQDNIQKNYEAFHGKYWDARVFGNTFLESADEKGSDVVKANIKNSTRSGVIQVVNAHSVCPVEILRSTNTKKAGAQAGKDRGMAPLGDRRVLHGVYTMPFFVNPAQAHKTHCTVADVELFLSLLRIAYPATASRARPSVEVRHAFVGEHKSPLGSFSDFDFVAHFTPKVKSQLVDKPSTAWSDYEVETELGMLEGRVENFRDVAN